MTRKNDYFRLAVKCIILALSLTWVELQPVAAQGPDATPTGPGSVLLPPRSTLTPTPTPTPTVTQTPAPICADHLEPNDGVDQGTVLALTQAVDALTIFPQEDIDTFQLWGKEGAHYDITTQTGEGVDTRLRVYDPVGRLIAENDDYRTGIPTSQVRFQASGDGWFTVAVDTAVPIDWGCRTYRIIAVDMAAPTATPTKTPGPTATPLPPATAVPGQLQPDAYEPNWDFERAANLGVGQRVKVNFNPWPAGASGIDNDFYRLFVKVGQMLKIETDNLSEGLDTNIILYRGDQSVIAGNDDCSPTEFRSCLEWAPDYTGLVYVLVGPVGTLPEAAVSGARNYSLSIINTAAQTPTPTPVNTRRASGSSPVAGQTGEALPWRVTPLPSQTPTPTPTPRIFSSVIGDGAATPTPKVRQPILIDLTLYYDENNNGSQDPSEGVVGASVRVLDERTGRLLGHVFTDPNGHARLMVSAEEGALVSVPYLAYSRRVRAPGDSLVLKLQPQTLPSLIP